MAQVGEVTIETRIRESAPVLWANPDYQATGFPDREKAFSRSDYVQACERWRTMQPLFRTLFPDSVGEDGIVSPLTELDAGMAGATLGGEARLVLKRDDSLAVAGSVKARGGFHEVAQHAYEVAIRTGVARPGDGFAALASAGARVCLGHHRLLVASTGNLGLSVGLIGRALGFSVEVHMSRDARTWKKQRLRQAGARVIEHASDYISAVRLAAAEAEADPAAHFVDDERSAALFLGYAAAAPEVKAQLETLGLAVGPDRPLFVYLPCGIGGAPGGIAWGLRQAFGADVHCLFVEPVAAPCMLVQMLAGRNEARSVYDFGLDGRTLADGLAVTQASRLVADMMRTHLAGILTEADAILLGHVRRLYREAGLRLEPSATAGLSGPVRLLHTGEGEALLARLGIGAERERAIHLVWSTGGALVPDPAFRAWLD
ncbi:D-serine ammonia-lyase [Novosphingobium profundi]|nr:D-serine ammonia-lyase [Novosphingobium profundi]MBT0668543.1 D-serine ammonia-lyase [Novosphingobium profundi]